MDSSTEAQFAQQLASNQPPVREEALKKLGKWIRKMPKDACNEQSLLKIWKGLYYYFWHCDKMLVQEEKADIISAYIHKFKNFKVSLLYLDVFLKTMAREWHCIDRYRIEKFLMLVRRMLHEGYKLLQKKKWDLRCIKSFHKVLKNTVINSDDSSAPNGLKYHICDIYMEELAQVAADEISPSIVRKFLIPYCRILCYSNNLPYLSSIKKDVFMYLVNQDVDDQKFQEFPILKFKPEAIQKLLMKCTNLPNVARKNIKIIHRIVQNFDDFKNNIDRAERAFNARRPTRALQKSDIDQAAREYFEDEEEYTRMSKEYKKKKRGMKYENDSESEFDA